MIMRLCHRHPRAVQSLAALLAPLLLLVLVLHAGSASAAKSAGVTDANAAIVSAESALQRADCGAASTLYQKAAQQLAQVELSARATNVALACGQFAAAEDAAQRWTQLAPKDSTAGLALVQAELGAYRLVEARAHFKSWLAVAGRDVPAAIDALATRAGNEPALAMLRELDDARLRGVEAQRMLAELALDSWDGGAALRFVQGARTAGAAGGAGATASATLASLAARAHAMQGNEAAATGEARAAAADKQGRLALAQSFLLLGKSDAAEAELQRLRGDADVGGQASRQLVQLALEKGDYAVAEQRCNTLEHEPGSSALAMYVLGLIAERRGDDEAALRAYELLSGTGFEPQGRRRAAGIIYAQGEREAALRLLAVPRDAEPGERIRGEIAAADLLSLAGAPEEAVGRIEVALRRAPGNPELDYQRAVLLERAGRVDAAIKLLETLHASRPLDAAITNALGFTLADHKRDLPRAEQLIRAALQAQPDNPAMLDSLGWALYRRGQFSAAVSQLERAFRLQHDGDIGAHWGEALWASGQKSAARAAWQRALAADPDNKLLVATAARYARDLSAPAPPPALEPASHTSI
jgi:Tfp pilus assembly protein PilF